MQRCQRFLDELSKQLRDKAFDFCSMKDWKLSIQDIDTQDPVFAELKNFILGKTLSSKKRTVYNKEHAMKGYHDLKESNVSIVKTPPVPTSSPAPTPNSDPTIIELTKQLAKLILVMQASMNPQQQSSQTLKPTRAYDRRCI